MVTSPRKRKQERRMRVCLHVEGDYNFEQGSGKGLDEEVILEQRTTGGKGEPYDM